MKKKLALFVASLYIFNVCSAQSIPQSQGTNYALIGLGMAILLIVLMIGIPSLWASSTNKKFKGTFPQYHGKYLWSLLFFPCFYTVVTIFLLLWTIEEIVHYEIARLYITLLVCIAMVISSFLIRKRINRYLLDWNQDSADKINKLVMIYVCFPPLYYILYPITMEGYLSYIDFDQAMNTFSMIFYLILGITIWYFSHKKLATFSLLLPYQHTPVYQKTSLPRANDVNKSSMSDRLIELKKILDEGIITEEEFAKLKKEIISEYK